MHSCCLVIPYYGRWPVYFPLFLKGCEYNPDLTVLLVTDLDVPLRLPENVKVISYSMQQLREKAENVLQTPVCLPSAQKLCDLKPMYGIIFEDELQGFDYWAHGDIDLLYGNLSPLMQELMTQEYDVISFDQKWLSGPFCLYRNRKEVNELFRHSRDWGYVCASEKHLLFDEIGGNFYQEIIAGTPVTKLQASIEAMSQIVFRKAEAGELKFYHGKHIHEPYVNRDLCYFVSGELFSNRQPIFIHHFLFDKRRCCFQFPSWKTVPNEFYFDGYGFYTGTTISYRPFFIFRSLILSPGKFIRKAIPSIWENGISGFLRTGIRILLRMLRKS